MGSKVCAHCGSSEKLSQILPTLKTNVKKYLILIEKSGDTYLLITVNNIGIYF